MFGDGAVTATSQEKSGINLDDSLIKVIEASWRCTGPSKLTVYKEGYRSVFLISEASEVLLCVPSLDGMIETLLVKISTKSSLKMNFEN